MLELQGRGLRPFSNVVLSTGKSLGVRSSEDAAVAAALEKSVYKSIFKLILVKK